MKRFSTFYVVVVFTVLLGLGSCKNFGEIELDGACDAGTEYVNHLVTLDGGIEIEKFAFPLPKGNIIFYENYGDSIRFIIYQEQTNICTKEHLKVEFLVTFAKDPPPSFKAGGEVVWSASFPSAKVNLTKGNLSYIGSTEAGLKQVFKDKAASVDCYLTIQFESQGSQLANIAYLREYVSQMYIIYNYSKHTR